ncbi:hypothetical protein ElyMa_001717300 [Elysia marginata]|uniref:Uncharacterized protein n=1 Tax=Elysia marginata TaxID=1093978 RepID=A0AAV4JVF1_9GAST|nr:hypothetical protein ElyMa_001717300 [Elysia marginata]
MHLLRKINTRDTHIYTWTTQTLCYQAVSLKKSLTAPPVHASVSVNPAGEFSRRRPLLSGPPLVASRSAGNRSFLVKGQGSPGSSPMTSDEFTSLFS